LVLSGHHEVRVRRILAQSLIGHLAERAFHHFRGDLLLLRLLQLLAQQVCQLLQLVMPEQCELREDKVIRQRLISLLGTLGGPSGPLFLDPTPSTVSGRLGQMFLDRTLKLATWGDPARFV
jgi:hypothetical protein